jgi:hypothetical protein
MNIILFYLVTFTLSFAIVYKRPLIFKPIEWIFPLFGIKKALDCMLCMPMYIAAALSMFSIIFLPDIIFSPALSVFGKTEIWYYVLSYVFIDALSASAVIYSFDQLLIYIEKNEYNQNILHD